MSHGFTIKPPPGDRVRLVRALRVAINEDAAWKVVACTCELCARGRHVAVNEPSHAEGYTNVPPAERPRWRHISYTSLEAVRVPDAPDTLPSTPRVKP